jgi:hypothetical protein
MLNRHRNRFLAWLLPAILLFAQQAAMVHLTLHASGESSDPESALVHAKLCNKCLSIEKLTTAVVDISQRPVLEQHRLRHAAALATNPRSREIPAQSCRDPPKNA